MHGEQVVVREMRRVTYQNVLDDIHLSNILTQGSNADPMRSIAMQILHQNLSAIRLETDTIIAIVNDRILNHHLQSKSASRSP